MADALHVLVVDESAVARVKLGELLTSVAGVHVSLAGDARVARARIALDPPDVVLLSLDAPTADGHELLHWLATTHGIPVVVCSVAPGPGELERRALAAGARAVVAKPLVAPDRAASQALIGALRAAHREHAAPSVTAAPRPAHARPLAARVATDVVIAIGASTGGTDALATLVPQLPGDVPGVVIVQHMPAGFTRHFAARLDQMSVVEVREATTGDVIERGLVLIAPGGRHTRIRLEHGRFVIEVFDGPLVCQHRPSVDVLFESVASVAGYAATGAILTGMGADGTSGLLAMRRAGARTFAQDQASCAVYGMPRVAIERGAAEVTASIDELAPLLVRAATGALLRGAARPRRGAPAP